MISAINRFSKLVLASSLVISNLALAHTHWTQPIPRTNENIKASPCGALPGPRFATYTEGDTITVSFNEFVRHSGFFGVAIAKTPTPTSDSDFVPLANPIAAPATNPYPNYMNPAIHIFNTQDRPGNTWTVTFQLPAGVSCTYCVLQVIEYMMDAGASLPPTLYHSCSDITINALVGETPDTGSSANSCASH